MPCSITNNSDYFIIRFQNATQCSDNEILYLTVKGFSNKHNTMVTSSALTIATFAPDLSAVDISNSSYVLATNLQPTSLYNIKFSLLNNMVGANTSF